MFIIILCYLVLSLFMGTLIILNKYKNVESQEGNVNVTIILFSFEVLILFGLFIMAFVNDIKESPWFGPILSVYLLIGLALLTVIAILILIFWGPTSLGDFFREHGEKLAIYSMICAIILFLIVILVGGILYNVGLKFNTDGLANLIGLTGIITTLLGILLTLFQRLEKKNRTYISNGESDHK